jgi:hypothetical protein
LQGFREKLGKENKGTALASGSTLDDLALNQALEKARAENKKFLEGFSEQQKSGLREITRKLIKADSELAQQANAFHQQIGDGKAVGPQAVSSQIGGFAQNLERTLASFRGEQLDLGQEMSIVTPASRQEFTLNIPPVTNSVRFADQPISITTSGAISRGSANAGPNTFALELTADMSDLQQNITEVLRAALDKADRCGERIAIQTAALMPLGSASMVVVNVHYERWACLGRETNEIVEGNGALEVKLTPAIGKDGTPGLGAEIARVDAEGLVGELLRSGSLGESLRDKIAEALLPCLWQGTDYKAMLPAAARGEVTLHRARFEGTGLGKLSAVLNGEIRVPSDKVSALTGESANGESNAEALKTGESKTDTSKTGASKEQASSPDTVPR